MLQIDVSTETKKIKRLRKEIYYASNTFPNVKADDVLSHNANEALMAPTDLLWRKANGLHPSPTT